MTADQSASLIELLIVLASIAAFFGLFFLLAWLGHWMLAPLEQRARRLTPVTRFLVVDALALMAMLQGSLAGAAGVLRAIQAGGASKMGWGAMVFVVTTLVWWAGVELVSRAGITDGRRRFVFLVAGVPATFASALVLCFGIPALFMAAADATKVWLPALALPLLPLPWLCRRLNRWVTSP